MKHLDEEVNFVKCEHNNLSTNCNVCFVPVFDSFMEFARDMYKEQNEEPHIHSLEFLRNT